MIEELQIALRLQPLLDLVDELGLEVSIVPCPRSESGVPAVNAWVSGLDAVMKLRSCGKLEWRKIITPVEGWEACLRPGDGNAYRMKATQLDGK